MESDLKRIKAQWDLIKGRLETIEQNCETLLEAKAVASTPYVLDRFKDKVAGEPNVSDRSGKVKQMQNKYKTIGQINHKLSMLVCGSNVFKCKTMAS